MNRFIIAACFFLTLSALLRAQDSIIYMNIYRYEILDGKATSNNHISEQHTYNLEKNEVLTLHYYDSLPDIISFTRYFYQNGLLFSEETFDMKNNPLSITRYSYGESGLKTEERTYEPDGNSMECIQTISWKYNGTLPVKEIVKNKSGKKIRKTLYTYTDNKNSENTRFYKRTGAVYPVSANCTSVFSDSRIISRRADTTFSDGHSRVTAIEYVYDEEHERLLSENWYNEQHETVKTIEYKWKSNGIQTGLITNDSAGNCLEYLIYRYDRKIINLRDQEPYELGGSNKKLGVGNQE